MAASGRELRFTRKAETTLSQFPDLRTGFRLPIILSLIAIATHVSAKNFLQPYRAITVSFIALGDWQLRIERNRFSGNIACRLRSRDHHGVYAGRAIGFRLGKHMDTTLATYRLDGGPAHEWRDQLPELIRLGTPIDGPGLDDPTGGFVWLPLSILRDVSRIAIQGRPDRRPEAFHLRGFAGLHDTARTRGCSTDQQFVR